jgi:hypothetical protein
VDLPNDTEMEEAEIPYSNMKTSQIDTNPGAMSFEELLTMYYSNNSSNNSNQSTVHDNNGDTTTTEYISQTASPNQVPNDSITTTTATTTTADTTVTSPVVTNTGKVDMSFLVFFWVFFCEAKIYFFPRFNRNPIGRFRHTNK